MSLLVSRLELAALAAEAKVEGISELQATTTPTMTQPGAEV